MLAKYGRRAAQAARSIGELYRQADGLDVSRGGMLGLDNHFACQGLRIRVHLAHLQDWPCRDAGLLEAAQPFGGAATLEERSQRSGERLQITHAVGIAGKAR